MNLDADGFFDDGEHILYVNGAYLGNSGIGRLMHDFRCSDPDDMYYDLMAERTRYLKETPEGVDEVSTIVEEIVDDVVLQNIRNLMETLKLSAEEAMDALKVSDCDRKKYLSRL